jgi:hypothetical protein
MSIVTFHEFANRRRVQDTLRRAGIARTDVAAGHAMAWRLIETGATSHRALRLVKRAFGLEP